MPSSSMAQRRFMEMVAHNPKAAKRVGVPQSVGEDFASADSKAKVAALRSKTPHAKARAGHEEDYT